MKTLSGRRKSILQGSPTSTSSRLRRGPEPTRPQIHGQARRRRPRSKVTMPDTLNVNLGDRSYPILFAEDLTAEVRALVAELAGASRRIAVITDRNVATIQASTLQSLFADAPTLIV